jgi:outer membrane receptor protein involved in Fe transport
MPTSDREVGRHDVTDYLKTLPALVASTDKNDAAGSNTFIGGTGLTLLNLRSLGEDRTLVLVNGRRHVAGLPGSAAVDVDTIPFALLERVDIQTGGASALYGADGVSGVVNFILRRDYEGFDVRAQYGASGEGDADTVLLSGVLGQNVDDGRGNVTVALEYSKEKRLRANDRDFAGGGGLAAFSKTMMTRSTTIRMCRTRSRIAMQFSGTAARRAPFTPTSTTSRTSTATMSPGTSVPCRSYRSTPSSPRFRLSMRRAATARGSINTSGT